MAGATGAERLCVISWMCHHHHHLYPNPTTSVVTGLRFVLLVAALTHHTWPPSLSVLAIRSEI